MLRFLGKLLFVINLLVALLLLISFVLPYLPPSVFPTLSLLSLAVSPLILLNVFFAIYWLLRFKKRIWFSLVVLVVAYFHFQAFFEISASGDRDSYDKSLKVLSYNVRLFNAYEKIPKEDSVANTLKNLIATHQPDVLCIQEYYAKNKVDFSSYPFQYIHFKDSNHKLGHAIFSRYPIIDRGAFDFEGTYNNTIFADVKVGNDTLRVYNLHLQSLGILPTVDFLQQRGAEKIRKRMRETFVQQEYQVKQVLQHKAKCPYETLVSGDFNNTAFSYIYQKLKLEMNDAFEERGNGLGATFSFNHYPLRIDFILASETIDCIEFTTGDYSFSDHYPIIATLGWH
ncbi:MAG TPA: endonuclease/exonuclease/phosphatase family protein [Flavobacteriaceae bacterium]|nr:endonuclease/exonuclease/phosphatase family protein [Flavobacteriaceae bacterium]MCB9212441.1 endonuclease/exonuclease/phosphatase family protein [Alteromonas sp.]HPF11717.1 endonuclease/exonuclease/phosphatase family protein [Flavobacteriaceae bacterium]HQU20192.1 endonuclease/exonuclease/phosphatase family protein [Flavobacteriaceae bacterium]HQU64719.1 endonuclease/exonuclease/phosphatase family protein [Flavobacteriaceae bacterium]